MRKDRNHAEKEKLRKLRHYAMLCQNQEMLELALRSFPPDERRDLFLLMKPWIKNFKPVYPVDRSLIIIP